MLLIATGSMVVGFIPALVPFGVGSILNWQMYSQSRSPSRHLKDIVALVFEYVFVSSASASSSEGLPLHPVTTNIPRRPPTNAKVLMVVSRQGCKGSTPAPLRPGRSAGFARDDTSRRS